MPPQTLPALHRGTVVRRDAFHFGPVSRFLVARIAQYHAVGVEGVAVTFPLAVFHLENHRGRIRPASHRLEWAPVVPN